MHKKRDLKIARKVINKTNLSETDILAEYIIDEAFQFPTIIGDSDPEHTLKRSVRVNENDPLPEYENKSVEEKKLLRGELIIGLVERNTNIKTIEMLIKYIEVATIKLNEHKNISSVFEELYKKYTDPKKASIDKIISSPKRHMSDWGSNKDDWGSNKGIVYTLAGTKGGLLGIELLTKNSEGEWTMNPLGELVAYIYIDKNNDYPVDELCHKYALNKNVTDEENRLIRATIPTFNEINNTEIREKQSAQD